MAVLGFFLKNLSVELLGFHPKYIFKTVSSKASLTYFILFQLAVCRSDFVVIVWQTQLISVARLVCKIIDPVQFIDTVNCLQAI